MAITYLCRHCNTIVGRLEDSQVTEQQLGFTSLTPDERRDIIAYDSNGDINVKVTCEYCSEALRNHPELALISNPLQ
ncbi:anti-sigma-F factor Fin family protein [Paenibacillus turicensis]|jgi:hypothetical protein|uniref:DUF2757 domain-containing protein n=1 Tax=Paenibacillus turicensis TaxID=160487 RepID=A0ABS4FXP1_9BACL|nr:anti-sigma-F factor Fin family protein [Paenibacillus turicensis]MBP1907356.1 hypothetical protein [Paenibacillus turicensis]